MDTLQATILALVQGLTEFLPISSSAHLILVPKVLGWPDQGLAFDVAVHLGTLIAVFWFFRGEVIAIISAWLRSLAGREHEKTDARLAWAILVATLPVVFTGFFLEDFVESQLRSPLVIAGATAAFGVLLWLADLRRKNIADEHAVTLPTALLIGLAQVLALVPGTSRSGITITAGLFLGLSRQAACRFSFLLAMPAIGGAAVLEFYDLLNSSEAVAWDVLAVGLLIAAVSAYLCIKLFLQAVEKIGMLPFMLYRLVLAAILFLLFI
ncbi:MAG: undecaprenyl-diphosphate phosphatase [Gammaproteobacteria bacterium]|nr:undecaprenyl-diphosphate phosphatase [Gammaproteobacteria bacterium]